MASDSLFDDLSARFEFARRQGVWGEASDRREVEVGGMSLLDRLRPGAPESLTCRLRTGGHVVGRVVERGASWFALQDGGRGALVPLASAAVIVGARIAGLAPRSAAEAATPMSVPLRAIARSGREVHIEVGDSGCRGSIGAVGADHLVVELRTGEPFASARCAVCFDAIAAVRYSL